MNDEEEKALQIAKAVLPFVPALWRLGVELAHGSVSQDEVVALAERAYLARSRAQVKAEVPE